MHRLDRPSAFLLTAFIIVAACNKSTADRISARRRLAEADSNILRVASWNVAAINNNPFEYWITHPSTQYNQLMQDVQAFIDNAGSSDVPVNTVLTDVMVDDLSKLMRAAGWTKVDEAVAEWKSKYATRTIISGFMKDAKLGKKRLMSMPDRVTNTINLRVDSEPRTAMRPTVINCYPRQFASPADHWKQWTEFMFSTPLPLASGKTKTPSELVTPISAAKYPALTAEEEAMSRPLSMICQV